MLLPKKFCHYLYKLFTDNCKVSMHCIDGTVKSITLNDSCIILHEPNDPCHLITLESKTRQESVKTDRVIDLIKTILIYRHIEPLRAAYCEGKDLAIVLTSNMPFNPCDPKSLYTLNIEVHLNGELIEKWHLTSKGLNKSSGYSYESMLDDNGLSAVKKYADSNTDPDSHIKLIDDRGYVLALSWSKLHTLQYNHSVYAERHLTALTNIVYRLLFTNEWVEITYDFTFGAVINIGTHQMDTVNLQVMLPNDCNMPLEFPSMYRYIQTILSGILQSSIESTEDLIEGTTQKRYILGRNSAETKAIRERFI